MAQLEAMVERLAQQLQATQSAIGVLLSNGGGGGGGGVGKQERWGVVEWSRGVVDVDEEHRGTSGASAFDRLELGMS